MKTTETLYSLYTNRLTALHQDASSAIENLASQLKEPLKFEDTVSSVAYPEQTIISVSFVDGGASITLDSNYEDETYSYSPCEMDIWDLLWVLSALETHFEQ